MTSSTEMVTAFYTGFLNTLTQLVPLLEISLTLLFFLFAFGAFTFIWVRGIRKVTR